MHTQDAFERGDVRCIPPALSHKDWVGVALANSEKGIPLSPKLSAQAQAQEVPGSPKLNGCK